MTARVALILAGRGDASSEAVGLGLAQRGCPVVRASAAELALAKWYHAEGEGTRVVLPDGTPLDDGRIGAVLNRLEGPDLPQFARAPAEDRDYAVAEFAALLASWLNGLSDRGVPVANPPGSDDAWSAALHPLGWHTLAVAHRLKVGDFAVASSVRGGVCRGLERVGAGDWPSGCDVAGWYRTAPGSGAVCRVWVFGADCGGLEAGLATRCTAFVRALGLRYAALDFVEERGGLRLIEVVARPPLDDAALAGRCVHWLSAALEGAQ